MAFLHQLQKLLLDLFLNVGLRDAEYKARQLGPLLLQFELGYQYPLFLKSLGVLNSSSLFRAFPYSRRERDPYRVVAVQRHGNSYRHQPQFRFGFRRELLLRFVMQHHELHRDQHRCLSRRQKLHRKV